ncbi:N-acetylmuramidase family protein [Flavobacterium sp. Fl-318]|uniref:N-acetylmuramidase family protein n=1 Tax=Flavobacterium cupriresistens TaxID=2893885 RepID=A0ABU4RFH8_9FLAO|nr:MULTISPECIES: N-acetylmuramidase family protein [unclassified Flavobacterium]MDX6189256.1 N-acetylmuramidase family protein [Flavobacterium sp. Fl-318]UFH41352.1 N-acetylmuramidase family protein [Flavobacterium sp. F-323]
MRTIKFGVKSSEVYYLNELLTKRNYSVIVSDYFGVETDKAVKDFQLNNNLVVDGIVGLKTWSMLLEQSDAGSLSNNKLLSEQDLIDFSNDHNLELAVVKAVNQVESNGKGFLVDGRPKILFEGHVFWRELKKRGINSQAYVNSNTANILYQDYTKKYYVGGEGEYTRLEKAMNLNSDPNFSDAAKCSTSWGLFQVMGFNAVSIGYANINEFTEKMNLNEGEHLKAFGFFLKENNLISVLRNQKWVEFALKYNGEGYRTNKYDEKLKNAYERFAS